MKRLQDIILRNSLVFFVYLALFLIGLVLCIVYNKLDIALYVNRLNSPFTDFFFKFITNLGTFGVIGPVLFILMFVRYRFALIMAGSTLLGFILVQIGKLIIWRQAPRPRVFFEHLPDIHYVDGVDLHSSHSFPSGHTQGAFAMFVALALFTKKRMLQLLFLLLALLTGYSRMYLSQHFLVDVVVGSAIGTFSALLSHWYFTSVNYVNITVLDSSLSRAMIRARLDAEQNRPVRNNLYNRIFFKHLLKG